MDVKESITSQYQAALAMLQQVIEACPDEVWVGNGYVNQAWNIAYHALFYTRLYLSRSEGEFKIWAQHRDFYHEFGVWPEPYSKAQVLEYLGLCRAGLAAQVGALDLDAPSGFPWLPFTRHELHLYNIRHIMLHTGELAERIGGRKGCGLEWVAKG